MQQMPPQNNYGGYGPGQPMQPNPAFQQPKKSNKVLIIVVVVFSILLIGALSFAFWSFSEMNKYKNDTQAIVDKEVEIAKQNTATEKDKEFVEREKNPYKSYKSSDVVGSVGFQYPKTWAAYIQEDKNANSGTPIDGFVHPDYVPGKDSGTAFALRVKVENRPYNEMLGQYDGKVKQGVVKIQPYSPSKVPSVLGVKIEGEINRGQQNTLVMLPIRDKTLLISTESPQYVNDFSNVILSSLTFSP